MGRKPSLILLIVAAQAAAQRPTPTDTARAQPLNAVIVTADRATGSIRSSVSAVTRISRAELGRIPRATLADLLRLAPGFTVVDFDGLGFDPQLMARGFYGGGEAEYVIVLVDGKPVNQLQTGVVAWDALPPPASIEAVEVVRGGASSLYGDAAIAGVINVITQSGITAPEVRWDAGGGSFGTYHGAAVTRIPAWGHADIAASFDRTAGFRDHATRRTGRAYASFALAERPAASLVLAVRSTWRDFDEPGPQLDSVGAASRARSDPLFRFDHTTDRDHAVSLDGARAIGSRARLTASLGGELRATDAIRTLALAPGFGDTKERDASTGRLVGSTQVEIDDSPMPGSDRLILGGEAAFGALDSKYYNVTGGARSAYVASTGARGALDTDAGSARRSGALYTEYSVRPVDALRLSLGGRLDRIGDRFDPRVPTEESTATTTHTAFSPRVGLNFGYRGGSRGTGNAYATFSRSFKAPTLDQLYDQRNVPVPFPPFQIRTSNPDLRPQHGTNIEGGIYQTAEWSTSTRLGGSVSAFQTDMTDELDFDIESFKYVNIGKSRHRGIEAGANVVSGAWSAFATYALQAATLRTGDFAGNRLKAIPRHTIGAGFSVQPVRSIEASLYSTHVRGIFLDDGNSVALPDHTRFDGRVSFALGAHALFVDVRNLFDSRFSSTGFLDPSGSGQQYLYPAAGRVVEVGVKGSAWWTR